MSIGDIYKLNLSGQSCGRERCNSMLSGDMVPSSIWVDSLYLSTYIEGSGPRATFKWWPKKPIAAVNHRETMFGSNINVCVKGLLKDAIQEGATA